MRNSLPLIAAIAIAVAPLPGDAQATSQTCSTSPTCDVVSNTYSGTGSGVAIHGAANSGIAIRGTSATNTGFHGASGSGSYMTPGVEDESTTNNTGDDAAGAFGLAYFVGGTNAYGLTGNGVKYGAEGETATASSALNAEHFGVVGFDESGGRTYNAGTAGISEAGVGVLGESNGVPTLGFVSSAQIGVYAVAEPAGSSSPAIGLEAESTGTTLSAQNTTANQQAFVDLADVGSLFYGTSLLQGAGILTSPRPGTRP